MEGCVIWFTGLSGSGKSTLANALHSRINSDGRYKIEILDGDEIRTNLSKGLGFSKEDRDINVRRIGYVANLLSRNGIYVLVAAISPYRSIRDELKGFVSNFIEVHCDASIDECKKRDPKGLYKKVEAGEIKNFTGITDPYEQPNEPSIHLYTESETVEESIDKILAYLEEKKLWQPNPTFSI